MLLNLLTKPIDKRIIVDKKLLNIISFHPVMPKELKLLLLDFIHITLMEILYEYYEVVSIKYCSSSSVRIIFTQFQYPILWHIPFRCYCRNIGLLTLWRLKNVVPAKKLFQSLHPSWQFCLSCLWLKDLVKLCVQVIGKSDFFISI